MTAAMTVKPGLKVSLLLVSLLVIAAVVLGIALTRRGAVYDPAQLPEMAATPVTLSAGAKIYVQKYEVSVAEWNTCHEEGACTLRLRVRSDQDARLTPATSLSYVDAGEYLDWINGVTGMTFRLPTLGEWTEMAASVLPEEADPIFTDPSLTWASTYLIEGLTPRALKPRGSFSLSPEGIADLDGSVWEWTGERFPSASDNADPARCPAFYVAGEHVAAMSYLIRDPARGGCAVGSPPAHLGMRLVSETAIPEP
ncbi:SUMF1/EgtB/PvdO family nonheme iron enzyme [Roseivivax sp. THAF30]|uniref:formylglycine-generating enzyme family protein n=1 Tax=Roseivivax sp. THAF30 TaxID=2587852 RepID=UPI00126938A5|nr:SUMF1/EgtB/PvdO family nonheme iron enzyme [Roseivivax sp. THAF30]QFT61941.1 Formylglycine-generating sulfatase enzyme [Roseivivax sp. THAF30]